ncbi:tetratricopeptide repeat-containing sulfotransferase family protein [Coralloluteibacterium stylophorae]|uniref:Sulfotransferase n=1 Tax=Coralloluteibacterium stylophorae TaxID=1776034 RepID=A0A8J7VUI1_9GAMM|nr:sulfotransferase [Coralloluteibacterium stylophorae]MBS7457183.1 sulfotransferase [Coralloluteibacterium stylophorae]
MIDIHAVYRGAVEALNRRDWTQALRLADSLLEARPQHAGVHFVAGVAALELRQMPRALTHLQHATRLNPQRADYLAQFARALLSAHRPLPALEAARRAWAMAPADPMTLDTLGLVFTLGNAYEAALPVYARLAQLQPRNAAYRFNHGTALTFAGRIEEATVELEACVALQPGYWKAHLSLAQLTRQTPASNHLERLRAMLAEAPQAPEPQLYLHLALAKELEDVGDHAAAFGHLQRGKAAGGAGRGSPAARDAALVDALIDAFPAPIEDEGGAESEEPIFVVGMPRSGTTLVDRILSNHPDVTSAGELQQFGIELKRASGSRTPLLIDPDTVAAGARADMRALGEAYLASTRSVTGRTPRFIDKLPHNFLYLGFIARAFPRARIVLLRRDPLDTCLGNFRQLFSLQSSYYDYSFDLLDTGRHYIQFERLVRHWKHVLPNRIHELHYETLVEAPEATVRQLLEAVGLRWCDACLRPQDNIAPVATASTVQVRDGVHRNAVGRWRNYESQLSGLLTLLEEAGIDTRT